MKHILRVLGPFPPCVSPVFFPPEVSPFTVFHPWGDTSHRRCSGFQLTSLALGQGTLVGTGSRQRHISHGGKLPGGNTGVETSGGESSSHHQNSLSFVRSATTRVRQPHKQCLFFNISDPERNRATAPDGKFQFRNQSTDSIAKPSLPTDNMSDCRQQPKMGITMSI